MRPVLKGNGGRAEAGSGNETPKGQMDEEGATKMKWIMLVLMFPVLPIIVAILANEAKPKKNIVIGVTLPYEARQTEQVQAACRAYRRRLWLWCGVLCALLLPSLLFRHDSLAFSWQMLWVLAAIAVPYGVYVRAHLRLRALKRENGWTGEAAGRVLVDLQAAAVPYGRIAAWWFLPAVLAAFVPVAAVLAGPPAGVTGPLLALYLTDAAMVAGCWASYRFLYRNRAEVVDGTEAVTQALTRVRRYHWGRFWLGMAYLMAAFAVAMWLLMDDGLGLLLASVAFTFALLLLALATEMAVRRAQFALTRESGQGVYADEDGNWWLGMFYYNPNDAHNLVNNRVGMGSTVNLARPAGKVLLAFTALCLLLIPAACGWVIAEEFTPLRVACADGAITADHLARKYTVPLADVEAAVLLDELPSGSKVVGTAIGTLCKGEFNLKGIGECEVFLYTDQPVFLRVDTSDTVYLFSGASEEETRALYACIRAGMAG